MKHRKTAKVEYPNLYASDDAASKNPAVFVRLCFRRYNNCRSAEQGRNTTVRRGPTRTPWRTLGRFSPSLSSWVC